MHTDPDTSPPFSLAQLLLNGFIIDRGQLTPARRAELDSEVEAGALLKDTWARASNSEKTAVSWRVPTVRSNEVWAVLMRSLATQK